MIRQNDRIQAEKEMELGRWKHEKERLNGEILRQKQTLVNNLTKANNFWREENAHFWREKSQFNEVGADFMLECFH